MLPILESTFALKSVQELLHHYSGMGYQKYSRFVLCGTSCFILLLIGSLSESGCLRISLVLFSCKCLLICEAGIQVSVLYGRTLLTVFSILSLTFISEWSEIYSSPVIASDPVIVRLVHTLSRWPPHLWVAFLELRTGVRWQWFSKNWEFFISILLRSSATKTFEYLSIKKILKRIHFNRLIFSAAISLSLGGM